MKKNYDGYALLMKDDFEFISGELVYSHYMTVCSNDVKAKTYGKESVDLHIFEPTKLLPHRKEAKKMSIVA